MFWRTAGSGARATVRGRQGRTTAGQHGDIAATDPIGDPLTKLITIELKRGYSSYSVHDLIDRKQKSAVQELENHFGQAVESARHAGSFAWMIVARRDKREALVWMPRHLFTELKKLDAFEDRPWPCFSLCAELRNTRGAGHHEIWGTTLDNFFEGVSPLHITQLFRKLRENK